jgi:ABC-type branched-subunit amino acid transport system ATPase component
LVRLYLRPGNHPMIEARGLTKRFGSVVAVDGLMLSPVA